jgi:hypothetical protein
MRSCRIAAPYGSRNAEDMVMSKRNIRHKLRALTCAFITSFRLSDLGHLENFWGVTIRWYEARDTVRSITDGDSRGLIAESPFGVHDMLGVRLVDILLLPCFGRSACAVEATKYHQEPKFYNAHRRRRCSSFR